MAEITPQEAFKSKAKFSEFMAEENPAKILSTIADYPKADGKAIITLAELTQSTDALIGLLQGAANMPQPPFLVWIITNEKEPLIQAAYSINKYADNKFGLFIFKASLIDDKVEFNCLLKPDKKSLGNNFTYAKEIQNKYWQKYFEICDEIGSDMQVSPKYQHWQYLGMGKKGVGLMLSVSTKLKYIGADLIINYNKSIYEKLLLNKEEIEKELGELEWINISDNKSSKIRKTLDYDVNNENQVEKAIKEHIKLAESFKATFSKYL